MIRVDRDRVPVPEVLLPGGPGDEERQKAEQHYAGGAEKTFSFRAYKHDDVRRALELLFHGKCAYCESRYRGTQPMDVEHWRPKARVEDDGAAVRGYFWLAAEWRNLLPSCIDCNRRRRQVVTPDGEERTVGKADQFPLAPGTVRAKEPGDEVSERPLLLDPCDTADDPEEHLQFAAKGVVRPRTSGGAPSEKGRASIEVYALNRSGLVHDRREVRLLLRDRFHTIRGLTLALQRLGERPRSEAGQRDDGQVRELLEDLLTHELRALRRFERPERRFSAMAKQMIAEFRRSMTGTADSGRARPQPPTGNS